MKQNLKGSKNRRLYLVRHGHVDYFDPSRAPLDPRSVSLSETGEALREIRAGRLGELPASSYMKEACGAYVHAVAPDAAFLRGESWETFRSRLG